MNFVAMHAVQFEVKSYESKSNKSRTVKFTRTQAPHIKFRCRPTGPVLNV